MVTESSVTELATYRVCKEASAGDKAAGEDDGEDEGGGAPEYLGANKRGTKVEAQRLSDDVIINKSCVKFHDEHLSNAFEGWKIVTFHKCYIYKVLASGVLPSHELPKIVLT